MAIKKPKFHPDGELTLAAQAYIQIRNKILKGEIGLGQALSRRNLADEFGMSFVPVGEAIQRLEAEGMVESRPRVGTRVRIPTAQDVRDRYIIREALEVQAARLFCEKASSMEREELSIMARRLDEMALQKNHEGGEQFDFQSYHVRFHMRIAECSGCMPLCEILEKNQVLIFNWLFDVAADSQMPAQWHVALMDVLKGNDPDAAALAMGTHIRTGMSDIQAAIAARFGTDMSWMQRRPAVLDTNIALLNTNSWRPRRTAPKK
jgi:GntR family transcriptional regulator, rspAB operon transcriptional repressor